MSSLIKQEFLYFSHFEKIETEFKDGVTDGARTRDNQNHNLALYQLNYGHHKRVSFIAVRCEISSKTSSIDPNQV